MGMFGWIGVGSSSHLRGQAFLRVMPGGTRAERGDWAWGDLGEEFSRQRKGQGPGQERTCRSHCIEPDDRRIRCGFPPSGQGRRGRERAPVGQGAGGALQMRGCRQLLADHIETWAKVVGTLWGRWRAGRVPESVQSKSANIFGHQTWAMI